MCSQDINLNNYSNKDYLSKNQKLLSIAFEINKEFNKYNLSIEDAEKVMNNLSTKSFMVNKNKCIRNNESVFKATISASPL